METRPGAVRAHNGAVETRPGVVRVHNEAGVEANPGAAEDL